MRRSSLSSALLCPLGVWVLCLCACQEDPLYRARWEALQLAADHPEQAEASVAELLRMVDDPRAAWRTAAQAALVRVAPWHAPSLVSALCDVPDASPEYRSALRTALRSSGAAGAEALLARLANPGHSNVRELGNLLAQLGAAALEPLRTTLRSEDPKLQLSALWTAGQMGREALALVPELITLAQAPQAGLSKQALASLVLIAPADERVIACLESVSVSADATRQAWALEALASTEFFRQRWSATAIWQRYSTHALAPAIEACASTDTARRALGSAVVELLWDPATQAQWREERPLSELLRELENEFPQARARACLQLGLRTEDRDPAIAALRAALRDSHAGVVACAGRALQHLGAQP